MDDDTAWLRQLLIGIALLLAVGALIGGIVAFASIKAADLAGIGSTSKATQTDQRLHVPRNAGTPTTAPSTTPPTGAVTSAPTTHKPPRPAFTLTISPPAVGTYQRIDLSGTYRAPDGTSLQVQRLEGGAWVDFPTTASVHGGSFATYVETGHTGVNRFRMTDVANGRSSAVATVMVH